MTKAPGSAAIGPDCSSKYRFGSFLVDPARRVLSRDSRPVVVTPKAFDVLLFMVRNPGRHLSKEEIIQGVWGDVAVEEGNLARNVSTLRRALGETPSERSHIVTEFGRGYRFIGAVQELTPDTAVTVADRGHRAPLAHARGRRAPGRRALLAGAALVLATILLLGYGPRLWVPGDGAGTIASIVVLPFAGGTDLAVQAVAEGLAESLATDFSQLEGLHVASRIIASRYAAGPLDVHRIGQELGVEAVVAGRIEPTAAGLTIEVELVATDDARRLWGRRFPAGEADLVSVQRAIVAGVLGVMGSEVPPAGMLAGTGTDDPEAYRLYLLGRHEWKRQTEAGIRASLRYYERALQADPRYALAYTGIADAYVALGMGFAHPRESFAGAKQAALAALQLDESLAPAYISLGAVRLFYDWDWEGAERAVMRARDLDRSYRSAIEVNTAYGEAFHYYCGYLEVIGRWDEAVAEIRRGLEIDPHSALLGAELAWSYYVGRRFDEAVAQARDTIARDRDALLAYSVLAAAYEALGRGDEAVATLESALDRFAQDPVLLGELGHAYGVAGRTEEARASLSQLADLASTRYVDPYFLALGHAGLGEQHLALAALEAAYDEGSPWLTWLTLEPRMDRLRDLPRFAQLVARVGPPPAG